MRSLTIWLLERPLHISAGMMRAHAPRWFSCRWRYQAGRNFLRLYLGPVLIDLLVRRRESGE
jgi:hypothetical protein